MNWVSAIVRWIAKLFEGKEPTCLPVPTHPTPPTVSQPVVVDSDPSPAPDPPPEPPVVAVTHDLPVLGVQHQSRFFHTPDGAVVDYRESTAMGLYRLWLDDDRTRVDALLSYFKRRKINAIRPLFNLTSDYWMNLHRQNSHVDDGDYWWGQLVPFINHVASFGIYTRCCLFGGIERFVGHQLDWARRPDVVSDHPDVIAKMHAYTEQFVGTTRDLPSVLYEVANEPSQIGFGYDSSVVRQLGERIKTLAPHRVMNFGAACDEDNLYYCTAPADIFDEHLRRMDDWDYLASCKRLIEQYGVDQKQMPFISGEWMNLGNVTRPGRSNADGTPSTATALCSSAMLRLKRAIPAFHAHCLLMCDVPDPATDAALVAWSTGLDLIPMMFPGSGCNGHWTHCSPFDQDIFPSHDSQHDTWDGPIRIFGLNGADGYLGVSIREPAGHNLIADRRPIETVHLEQWGKWQTRIIRA